MRHEELAKQYETDKGFRARSSADLVSMLARSAPLFGVEAQPSSRSDPMGLGNQVRERVNSSLYDMAARRAAEEGVNPVTFGHTHAEKEPEAPPIPATIDSLWRRLVGWMQGLWTRLTGSS